MMGLLSVATAAAAVAAAAVLAAAVPTAAAPAAPTAATAAAAARSPAPLHDALLALPFANSDVTRADHSFSMRTVPSIYLESETPLKARWSWADGRITPFHSHSYLFVENATANQTTGGVGQNVPGFGVPPAGMRSAPPLGGLATGTVELRADGSLQAWTIENGSPAGSAKMARLDLAVLAVRFPGSLSAVGVAAAPVAAESRMVRTSPPVGVAGVTPADGVAALGFSGAQPYTRLTPIDPAIPAGLNLQLFGRSRWRLGDMEKSHTPAVGFTLTASNPSAAPINVTLFLSLPMGLQHGVNRCAQGQGPECFLHPDGGGSTFSAPDAAACLAACTTRESCTSWNYDGAGTVAERGNCTLNAAGVVPPAYNAWNYYHVENQSTVPGTEVPGAASGVKGSWSHQQAAADRGGGDCLTLDRPGSHAQAGNLSMCASAEGGEVALAPSFCTGHELSELWSDFKADGMLCAGKPGRISADTAPIGAAAVTVTIPAGGNASATISMGWFFPHRDWAKSGAEPITVGNHYSSLFASSEAPARALLDGTEAAADVGNWSAYVSALTRSSLPEWYGDSLLNSLHHTRSAMWLSRRDDKEVPMWRQWESYSCVNVDSVHNDGERHLAYLMTFGEPARHTHNTHTQSAICRLRCALLSCGKRGGLRLFTVVDRTL
jgi:non-lysosomal glucosylceramidase